MRRCYKHGTPDGVQVLIAVAGYKHGTPDGVQVLIAVASYKHVTPTE